MNLLPSPEELYENLDLFVKLVEKYNIKPSELGIKPNYLYMIRKKQRKPSKTLCQRLIEVLREKLGTETTAVYEAETIELRRPDPSLRRLRGLADPTASPNVAGLTSGFDMRPGVSRPLWPGRAAIV